MALRDFPLPVEDDVAGNGDSDYFTRLIRIVYGCAALGYNGGKEPAAHPRKEGLVSYAE